MLQARAAETATPVYQPIIKRRTCPSNRIGVSPNHIISITKTRIKYPHFLQECADHALPNRGPLGYHKTPSATAHACSAQPLSEGQQPVPQCRAAVACPDHASKSFAVLLCMSQRLTHNCFEMYTLSLHLLATPARANGQAHNSQDLAGCIPQFAALGDTHEDQTSRYRALLNFQEKLERAQGHVSSMYAGTPSMYCSKHTLLAPHDFKNIVGKPLCPVPAKTLVMRAGRHTCTIQRLLQHAPLFFHGPAPALFPTVCFDLHNTLR